MAGGRLRAVVLVGLMAGMAVAWTGAVAAPRSASCPPDLYTDQVCAETVAAAMERGLPAVHPLILAATVTPGPDHANGQGLRDVVTFALVGVPGPTTVELHFDMSAHWGGVTSRGALELAAWSALVAVVAGLLAAAVVLVLARVAGRARRQPAAAAS